MPTRKRCRQQGFTLIELIVVVTIIGILAGVAVSNVKWAQQRARESALRHDLFEMRKAIDDYYADKQKYPDSLATLKSERYLRNIPKDPITMRPEWDEVQATPDPTAAPDPNSMPIDPTALGTTGQPGIADVKSKAPGNGLDGTPYNSW
jgi:general secretion pathway protein G